MNEMNCNNCQRWLHGYLDNELDTTTATLVAAHLQACRQCKRQYEEMKTLAAGVKEHAPYFEAPASLAPNVFSAIHAQTPPAASFRQTLREKSRNWFAPAFSMAALVAAALLYVATPVSQNPWVDEAVSEHVRSLMAEHLNDVASSDKHTVKPWFTGKIDFSPPVYDLTAQGYPLLGGRLDYLQHQIVAALTYRRNKHIINVFIMLTGEADSSPASLSARGYNIVDWQQNHMRFIAVSDLNAAELTAFAQFIQKGM